MILKILDIVHCQEQETKDAWYIYDNIASVQTAIVDERPDDIERIFPRAKDSEKYSGLDISIKFRDDKEIHLLVESSTFLLNDDGKTIERLF